MTAHKLVAYGCLIIALTFCSSGEPRPLSSADTLAATNYYVDSVNGSDSNQPNYTYQTGVSRRTGIYIFKHADCRAPRDIRR